VAHKLALGELPRRAAALRVPDADPFAAQRAAKQLPRGDNAVIHVGGVRVEATVLVHRRIVAQPRVVGRHDGVPTRCQRLPAVVVEHVRPVRRRAPGEESDGAVRPRHEFVRAVVLAGAIFTGRGPVGPHVGGRRKRNEAVPARNVRPSSSGFMGFSLSTSPGWLPEKLAAVS